MHMVEVRMMPIHVEGIDWKRTRILEKNKHLNFTSVHIEFSMGKKLWRYTLKICVLPREELIPQKTTTMKIYAHNNKNNQCKNYQQ